jgi:hypothetical protein
LGDIFHHRPHILHVIRRFLLHLVEITSIIPIPGQTLWVDHQKAKLLGNVIKPGVVFHLPTVTTTTMKSQDYRDWLFGLFRSENEILAFVTIDCDLVFGCPAIPLGNANGWKRSGEEQ